VTIGRRQAYKDKTMKKLIASTIGCILMISAGFAQETQPPHVTVYGTATTEVAPDQMVWSLKIENHGLKLDVIAAEHPKIVQAVLSLLKDSKVDEKTIQTSRMEFGERWEYKFQERVRDGYFAMTSVSFKITNFELYKKLWLGLAELPSVTVEPVTFDHTKRIAYQNETRQHAIQAAKEKAAALAKAIGSEIGEPLFIEEETIESFWGGNMASNNLRTVETEGTQSGDALAPGTIPIKTRVRASFRLISNPK
jgi:uncharacterized protein YggE